MPIQFADYSDLPLPTLFPRLASSLPGATQLKTRSDTAHFRPDAAVVLRREPAVSDGGAGLLRSHPFADSALRPFLEAGSEFEAQQHLQVLIERKAAPIISRVIRQKWHVTPNRAYGSTQRREEWEAEDLYSDTLMLLLKRLHACREDRAQPVITHFAAYVAMAASRVCAERLRHACPEREGCRQRLRYLLKTHPELSAWRDDWDRATCGLKTWQGRNASQTALQRLQTWESQRNSSDASDRLLTGAGLASLLAWLGGPVPQEKLIGTLAVVLQIAEPTRYTPKTNKEGQAEEDAFDSLANLVDTRVEVAGEVEQRARLRWLWAEIMELPSRQRAALLLNLRDAQNRGVLALLAHARIAAQPEIAQALGFSNEEFRALWPVLPLEDSAVAKLLSCTQQQVSNLRKAARARLSRRAACYEQG